MADSSTELVKRRLRRADPVILLNGVPVEAKVKRNQFTRWGFATVIDLEHLNVGSGDSLEIVAPKRALASGPAVGEEG